MVPKPNLGGNSNLFSLLRFTWLKRTPLPLRPQRPSVVSIRGVKTPKQCGISFAPIYVKIYPYITLLAKPMYVGL